MIGGSDYAAELAAIRPWADRAAAITVEERLTRIEQARRLMADDGVDALLVGAGASLSYFTGIGWGMIERLVAMVLRPGKGEVARHAQACGLIRIDRCHPRTRT